MSTPPLRPPPPFGQLLYLLLKQRKLGVRDFARRAGVPHTMLSNIKRGGTMPIKRAKEWAEILDLSSEERVTFVDSAGMTHTPPVVHDMIDRLVKAWQTRLADVEDRYQRLLDEVRRRG